MELQQPEPIESVVSRLNLDGNNDNNNQNANAPVERVMSVQQQVENYLNPRVLSGQFDSVWMVRYDIYLKRYPKRSQPPEPQWELGKMLYVGGNAGDTEADIRARAPVIIEKKWQLLSIQGTEVEIPFVDLHIGYNERFDAGNQEQWLQFGEVTDITNVAGFDDIPALGKSWKLKLWEELNEIEFKLQEGKCWVDYLEQKLCRKLRKHLTRPKLEQSLKEVTGKTEKYTNNDIISWIKHHRYAVTLLCLDPSYRVITEFYPPQDWNRHGQQTLCYILNNDHIYPLENTLFIKSLTNGHTRNALEWELLDDKYKFNHRSNFGNFDHVDPKDEEKEFIHGMCGVTSVNDETKKKDVIIYDKDDMRWTDAMRDILHGTGYAPEMIRPHNKSFIHPLSNQLYMESSDFYRKKNITDFAFEKYGYLNYKHQNQTIAKTATTIFEQEFGYIKKSRHTKLATRLLDDFGTRPITGQFNDLWNDTTNYSGNESIDDMFNEYSYLETIKNYHIDISKCYATGTVDIVGNCHLPWYTVMDNMEPFKPIKKGTNFKCGLYLVEEFIHQPSNIVLETQWMPYFEVQRHVEKGNLKQEQIKIQYLSKYWVDGQVLSNYVRYLFKEFPHGMANTLFHHFYGSFNTKRKKDNYAFLTQSRNVALAYHKEYMGQVTFEPISYHGTSERDKQPDCWLVERKINERVDMDNIGLYTCILGAGRMKLLELVESLINNVKNVNIHAVRVDSIYAQVSRDTQTMERMEQWINNYASLPPNLMENLYKYSDTIVNDWKHSKDGESSEETKEEPKEQQQRDTYNITEFIQSNPNDKPTEKQPPIKDNIDTKYAPNIFDTIGFGTPYGKWKNLSDDVRRKIRSIINEHNDKIRNDDYAVWDKPLYLQLLEAIPYRIESNWNPPSKKVILRTETIDINNYDLNLMEMKPFDKTVDYSDKNILLQGRAGSRKTGLLVDYANKWVDNKKQVKAVACTNVARQNMKERGVKTEKVETIASLLGWTGGDYTRQTGNNFDLLSVDEWSMISDDTWYKIAVKLQQAEAKIHAAGDYLQCVPVEGEVKYNIIKTQFLKELLGEDGVLLEKKYETEYDENGNKYEPRCDEKIMAIVDYLVDEKNKENRLPDILFMPKYKTLWVDGKTAVADSMITQRVAKAEELNDKVNKSGIIVDSRVICNKNDKKLDVWNGERYIIMEVLKNSYKVYKWEPNPKKRHKPSENDIKEIPQGYVSLANAETTYKHQGLTLYEDYIIFQPHLMNMQEFITALTRGKKLKQIKIANKSKLENKQFIDMYAIDYHVEKKVKKRLKPFNLYLIVEHLNENFNTNPITEEEIERNGMIYHHIEDNLKEKTLSITNSDVSINYENAKDRKEKMKQVLLAQSDLIDSYIDNTTEHVYNLSDRAYIGITENDVDDRFHEHKERRDCATRSFMFNYSTTTKLGTFLAVSKEDNAIEKAHIDDYEKFSGYRVWNDRDNNYKVDLSSVSSHSSTKSKGTETIDFSNKFQYHEYEKGEEKYYYIKVGNSTKKARYGKRYTKAQALENIKKIRRQLLKNDFPLASQ